MGCKYHTNLRDHAGGVDLERDYINPCQRYSHGINTSSNMVLLHGQRSKMRSAEDLEIVLIDYEEVYLGVGNMMSVQKREGQLIIVERLGPQGEMVIWREGKWEIIHTIDMRTSEEGLQRP